MARASILFGVIVALLLGGPAAGTTNKTAAPVKLSAFQQEQRMSFAARMSRWNPFIAEAASRFAVPQIWIRAVMQVESGGRTMLAENQPMRSGMGAMGLMQVMPSTYGDMRRQYRLGANPYDPHDNILAGAAYLKFLRGKYPYPALFAAYNDGPGNLEERLRGGGLLPRETESYVGNVTARLGGVGSVGRFGGIGGVSAAPRKGSVKLTKPNGVPVWIAAAYVVSVRAPFAGEYTQGVNSVVTVGRIRQGVRENPGAVKASIRAHGGGV
jgi:hypothetical protein